MGCELEPVSRCIQIVSASGEAVAPLSLCSVLVATEGQMELSLLASYLVDQIGVAGGELGLYSLRLLILPTAPQSELCLALDRERGLSAFHGVLQMEQHLGQTFQRRPMVTARITRLLAADGSDRTTSERSGS